jgi:type I restriction enzyme S subunit
MMNNLVASEFLDQVILVPCLEEQQKIADFLSAYDEAISYAKQELDKWKELKKGLLQQMFV